ncbi:hypothetical protein MBRA1_001190 [Malassezia brasiliensis]|uniref:Protein ROT1 n=1 Tax=Malassezia brasiliensis TaxID=1821822 RepID=A0AAF0DRB0_9BASI|nr:hypothetical protein MBRA1_001190 [Malassezia brasiliensis]
MLDVQPTLAAQHAAEIRGEQPQGHTVKLVALLLHACVRYALWAAGQVPAPLDAVVQELSYLLPDGAHDAPEVAQTSYTLDIVEPARRRPPRGPLRHAIALAQASADLEARLYAALRALQHHTPDQLQLAIVHGPSLHFARAIWFWTLDAGVPPPTASDAHDTAARKAQRKKTSSLLERKLIRHCMVHDALQGPSLVPCPTRVLLYAPHTLRVPGWTPRPHFKATIPPQSDEDAEAEEDTEAMGETNASHDLVADTTLDGTWSTGTGAVETGQKYFNIVNDTFTVPPLTGQAYSFKPQSASKGYYEELIYKFNTSVPNPGCYIAVLLWQHGNYTIHQNNSITMTPFGPDGRQQVSRPEEFMQRYEITTYLHYNQPTYKLQLYDFDGSMKPSMYLKYRPAAMYPSMPLHMNVIGVDS